LRRIRFFITRLKVYFNFIKIGKYARDLELDLQKIEQEMNNLQFRNDMSRDQKDIEFVEQRGVVRGIKWCLERVKKI
jgi:hypothetical protein